MSETVQSFWLELYRNALVLGMSGQQFYNSLRLDGPGQRRLGNNSNFFRQGRESFSFRRYSVEVGIWRDKMSAHPRSVYWRRRAVTV